MKTATYSQLLEAAQTLLSQWFARARFVSVSGGRLEPCDEVEDSLPCWPITDPDVPALLVASVLMGHRYHGWNAALREVQSRCERGAREKGSVA